jgi:HSP20 family molecular chaperone IbpA
MNLLIKKRLPLVLYGLCCFTLGALTHFLWSQVRRPESPIPVLRPSLTPPPATALGGLPSESEINEVRKLFENFFEEQFTVPPVQGLGTESITRREDERAIYYDLPIEGLKKDNLKLTIEDGQIQISGRVEGPGSVQEFHKSFPVPDGVDAERVSIRQEQDRVVIEFPRSS